MDKQSAKPVVYIASPFTKGDQIVNARCSILMMQRMIQDGIVTPLSPLSNSVMAHLLSPLTPGQWYDYDLELMNRCDACLRIAAVDIGLAYTQWDSVGADREEAYANTLGIPAFRDIHELYSWAEHVYRPVPLANRH